jgi:hypothetical protein
MKGIDIHGTNGREDSRGIRLWGERRYGCTAGQQGTPRRAAQQQPIITIRVERTTMASIYPGDVRDRGPHLTRSPPSSSSRSLAFNFLLSSSFPIRPPRVHVMPNACVRRRVYDVRPTTALRRRRGSSKCEY